VIAHAGLSPSNDLPQKRLTDTTERDELSRTKLMIKDLVPIATSTSAVVETIDRALSKRPAGIYIQSIDYERGVTSRLILGGISTARDAIRAFREALGKEPIFKSVTLPLDDLTGTEDGGFTITATGTF
jgi:hypothetical protein